MLLVMNGDDNRQSLRMSVDVNRYLFTVEEVGLMRGRGVMLLPGITVRDYGTLESGDKIELKFPDGRSEVTEIVGIENPFTTKYIDTPPPADQRRAYLLLPSCFQKEDIPVGTEVWTTEG